MRTMTIMRLGVLIALAGCGVPTDGGARLDVSDLDDEPRHVAQVSSALVAPSCTEPQRQAAELGQEILLRAVIDAANAYAANTNNPDAVEFFGVRDEEQTMTVYYNLLWAYQTLMGDGQDFDIEYRCDAAEMCGPDDLAWSGTPYVTVVCDPNNPGFWQGVPYFMSHEMWHWLGWGDPLGSEDSIEGVHWFAQNDVATAIQMPHAYYAYLNDYIAAVFTDPIYNP
jgi:hypothetical protein